MSFEKIRVVGMTEKEQRAFDGWWRENRTKLLAIYNEEINLNMAVLDIADCVWKGCLICQNNKND